MTLPHLISLREAWPAPAVHCSLLCSVAAAFTRSSGSVNDAAEGSTIVRNATAVNVYASASGDCNSADTNTDNKTTL